MSDSAWGASGPTVRAGWLVKQINKHLLTGTYPEKISSPAIIGLMNNSELSIRARNFRQCWALHSQGGGGSGAGVGGTWRSWSSGLNWGPGVIFLSQTQWASGEGCERHEKICLFRRWPVGFRAKESAGTFSKTPDCQKFGAQGRSLALV